MENKTDINRLDNYNKEYLCIRSVNKKRYSKKDHITELKSGVIPLLISAIKGEFSDIEYEDEVLTILINKYIYNNDIYGICLNINDYDKNYKGSYTGIECVIYLILYLGDENTLKYSIKLNWMTNSKNVKLWLILCREFDNYLAFQIIKEYLQCFSYLDISTKRQLDKTSDYFMFRNQIFNYYFNRIKHNFLLIKQQLY